MAQQFGQEFSQADTRALGEFTDQHGRTWEANTENKTRHPCSPYRPQFDAPFLPFNNYMDVQGTNRVLIQYKKWLKDLDEANAEYDRTLRNYAFQLYGEQAPSMIKDPPPELRMLSGDRPQRVPREFIEAAMQGNKWILGFSDAVPDWAKPLIASESEKKAEDPLPKYPDAPERIVKGDGYELVMSSPGRWLMPDGGVVEGNRSDALATLEATFPDEYALLLTEV